MSVNVTFTGNTLFSCLFPTYIYAPASGSYIFDVTADDVFEFSLNGSSFGTNGYVSNSFTGTLTLNLNAGYNIFIVNYQNLSATGAYCSIRKRNANILFYTPSNIASVIGRSFVSCIDNVSNSSNLSLGVRGLLYYYSGTYQGSGSINTTSRVSTNLGSGSGLVPTPSSYLARVSDFNFYSETGGAAAPNPPNSFSWSTFLTQTISSFTSISAKTPGASSFSITPPTASSGLNVAVTVKSGPATISGNTITLAGTEGTVVLAANQSGNVDYAAASEVTTSFTVGKLSHTITPFATIASKTPGTAAFTIALPTASSGLTVAVTVKSGPATISGNTITLTGSEGAVVLAANQSGNTQYGAASEVTTSFTVGKISIGISIENLNQSYTGQPRPVTITTYPTGFSTTVTYNGSLTVPTDAGTYSVSVVINDTDHAGSKNAVLFISPAPATISLSGARLITYDESPHGLIATTSPSGLATRITYNGSSTIPSNSGTYNVVATITDPNYSGQIADEMVIVGQPFYYNNATGDGSPLTLANWWLDSTHTNPATSLPANSDNIFIDGAIQIAGSYNQISGAFEATTTSFHYDQVIVGKYSTGTIIPIVWHNEAGDPTFYGIICNSIEFWNGASIDPQFHGGLHSRAVVHYPCAVPLAGLMADGGISYVGYPYAIAANALDIPMQTLWIDQSSHGTAQWSAVLPQATPAIQPSVALGAVKESDDFFFQVAFHSGNSFSDPQVTSISCTFLDSASGSVVFFCNQFIPAVSTQLGSSGYFSYLFYFPITGTALSSCLGSFQSGVSETITLIGEVKWQEINQTGVGPRVLIRRSQNFPLTVTRSLNYPTNFNPQ